jgi:hypothetical protein
MPADMKIITRRATEIVNRIAHAMTPQWSNLDACQWPCYPVAKSLSSEYVVAGCFCSQPVADAIEPVVFDN